MEVDLIDVGLLSMGALLLLSAFAVATHPAEIKEMLHLKEKLNYAEDQQYEVIDNGTYEMQEITSIEYYSDGNATELNCNFLANGTGVCEAR